MNLHGLPNERTSEPGLAPSNLAEVTLEASSDELRAIAWFLTSIANEADRDKSESKQARLSEALVQFASSPQLVVRVMRSPEPEVDLEQALREFEKMRAMLNRGGDGSNRA